VRRTHTLSFERGTWDTFIVPDVIVYSKKLGRYAGIRRSLPVNTDEPFLVAKKLPEGREWLDFSKLSSMFSLSNPWPDLFIYLHDEPSPISLVADCKFMARPDLILNIYSSNVTGLKDREKIQVQLAALDPAYGGLVLYRQPMAPEVVGAPETENNTGSEGVINQNISYKTIDLDANQVGDALASMINVAPAVNEQASDSVQESS
jgi:hypothetical protein